MARVWFLPLWFLWWVTALPYALFLALISGGRADLWLLALWWCKPLYEAPLLFWASRALLGAQPPWSATHAVVRTAMSRALLPLLLWRRLSLRRAFLMPVTIVEGLRGEPGRQRRRVLSLHQSAPRWLTILCYHFEAILWLGLLLTLVFLIPRELVRIDLAALVLGAGSWLDWLSALLYLLAFSVIAPVYVCAGFALYLTRRTELEAWDLEVAFRRAHSTPPTSGRVPRPGTLAGLTLIGLCTTLASGDAMAVTKLDPDQAQTLIQEILADEDFGSRLDVTLWLPPGATDADNPAERAWSPGVRTWMLLLATALKWLALALVLLILAGLVVRLAHDWRRRLRRPPHPVPNALPTWFGQAPDPVVPEESATRIRALLDAEQARAALARLYGWMLAEVSRLGPRLSPGATEGDCLSGARARLPAASAALVTRVIAHWRLVAYGRREPDARLVRQLFDGWCQVLGRRETTRASPTTTPRTRL